MTDWLRRFRNLLPTGELLLQVKARIQSHLNYYGVTDNSESCQLYLNLMLRKGQMIDGAGKSLTAAEQFYALAV